MSAPTLRVDLQGNPLQVRLLLSGASSAIVRFSLQVVSSHWIKSEKRGSLSSLLQ